MNKLLLLLSLALAFLSAVAAGGEVADARDKPDARFLASSILSSLQDRKHKFPFSGVSRQLQDPVCASEQQAWEGCAGENVESCANDFFGDGNPLCKDPYSFDISAFCPGPDEDSSIAEQRCECVESVVCGPGSQCCEGKCVSQLQNLYTCFMNSRRNECGRRSCDAPAAASSSCFPATAMIQVLGKGPVPMETLQVGDLVLTGTSPNKEYQSVYAFGHHSPTALGKFLEISTTATGATTSDDVSPLQISGAHLIFVAGNTNPVRADSLKVGDVLISNDNDDGHLATITSINPVEKTGLYAPLTASGKLVVNGVAVSSYIALQDMDEENLQLLSTTKGDLTMPHSKFVHLFLTPFRMVCIGISPSICQVYDSDGLPHYVGLGIKLIQGVTVGTQALWIQTLFFLLTVPLLTILLVLEAIFGATVGLLVVLSMAIFLWKGAPTIVTQHSMTAEEKKNV